LNEHQESATLPNRSLKPL